MSNISEVQLVRLLDRLVKKSCCNYYRGFCCIKDRDCSWREPDREFNNRAITCRWFREAVLPADKDLEAIYEEWKSVEKDKREAEYRDIPLSEIRGASANAVRCDNCLKPMVAQTNNHKYCDECSVIMKRQRVAARVRRHRRKTVGQM